MTDGEAQSFGRARLFDPRPHAAHLGNGRYTARITIAGGGGSSCDGLALTRDRADPVEDGDGWFVYLRDLECGRFWSVGYQPTGGTPTGYAALLSPDAAEIRRVENKIEAALTVAVAVADPVEIRRCTLINRADRPRRIEVTSYLEPVLLPAAADAAHPAFAKLFVQTEAVPERHLLLASRRPRGADEGRPWLAHWLIGAEGLVEHETDRARFIGRGRDLAAPAALDPGARLAATTGNVLDPVLALRSVVELGPQEERQLAFGLAFATERADALALAARYTTLETAIAVAPSTSRDGDPALDAAAGPSATAPYQPARTPSPNAQKPSHEKRFGDFSDIGHEYVMRLAPGQRPPLPWTHVVANEGFGFITSESGASVTWAGNSRENRITPWLNDPVIDPHGEALYVRDEESGTFWSPTPGPVPTGADCTIRYGFGYCRFSQTSSELAQEILHLVPRHDPLKITRVTLRNLADRPRRLSVLAYAQLVLGGLPAETAGLVQTRMAGDAILACNPARGPFADRVAFAAAVAPAGVAVHQSADRTTFIGRNGSPARPAALLTAPTLDGRVGRGLDPCVALQVIVELAPGETAEVAFLLGEGESESQAHELIRKYDGSPPIEHAFAEVTGFWRDLVAGFQLESPAPAIDLMANGWLVYQTLCCRLFARSAFYQSGGAFGFRDQLQDAAALIHLRPDLTRAQILLHAAHQFVEGDVLHWWHPPESRGIRTRFSDDLLWLPLVTAEYIAATGDRALLDELVRLLTARALEEGEDEVFLLPVDAGQRASIYEHCCLALDRALATGAHGLPLMGTGDWNDGMNRVGRLGHGESVWLGFFLHYILERFMPLCRTRGDDLRVQTYRRHQEELGKALDEAGWDGAWYRRAYYDDGTPLGAAAGEECRIDAIAQAWAVISGVAPPARVEQCLDALEAHLVDEEAGLIRLLTPPFDRSEHDPGYIKGYLPGVRENGGQYTHGALWAVQALAEAGRTERAAALLAMLSPVSHTQTPAQVATYQVEPYVIAADVYGAPPHVGRGGWTWYTGSAGWMLRVIQETLLGCRLEGGDTLVVQPRLPPSWPGCRLHWRPPGGASAYVIAMTKAVGGGTRVRRATIDGRPAVVRDGAARIPVTHDDACHEVRVELG